jgi:photosystem II stability/assembly factor-like uncharacterized protein
MKRFYMAIGCVLGLFYPANAAFANGRFPSAGHVEVDPADPAHVVLRATYGLVVTRDGGSKWHWICESAMSFSGIWDPPIGITAGGSVLVGLADGLSVSTPDGCNFSRASALEGKLVTDLAVDKTNPARAVVLTSVPLGATFDTRLYSTEDGGASFVQVGNVFPENLRGLTVDLAPSDPNVIYVSGVLTGPVPLGVVLHSSDGGISYAMSLMPGSDEDRAPFIGAVDPQNASRVYVRYDGLPGQLLVSEDAGTTWQTIFSGEGSLLGFALSPDGQTLVVGGEKDGVWRSPAPNWAFEKTSTLHARCLRWAEAGIYACTEQVLEGFSVGFSVTNGSTFGPLSKLSDLCGPVDCPASSVTASTCTPQWPALRDTLKTTSCLEAGSSSSGAGGAGGGNGDVVPSAVGGCACHWGGGNYDMEAAVLALSLVALRRHRRKSLKA